MTVPMIGSGKPWVRDIGGVARRRVTSSGISPAPCPVRPRYDGDVHGRQLRSAESGRSHPR